MKTKYRFIHFDEHDTLYGKRWYVRNNKSKSILGQIELYSEWDDYVFSADPKSVFNDECLKDIIDFISQLKKEGRR